MRTFRWVSAAVSAALCLLAMATADAAPAALGSGLREMTAAYEWQERQIGRETQIAHH